MAPEFACRTVKITEKCDVYGFGILVLEVVTGKRPVEYIKDDVVVLCDMVRGALEDDRVEECIDGRLKGNFPADEAIPVVKLGLICASQRSNRRGRQGKVKDYLVIIRWEEEEGLRAEFGAGAIGDDADVKEDKANADVDAEEDEVGNGKSSPVTLKSWVAGWVCGVLCSCGIVEWKGKLVCLYFLF
ncbi:hypothetical protein Tsubulata_042402 [Turnera subulata]|uniref:Serine-threonine/tyrosine-protein kinase catalytic domain-containing protein n=1 Tax=Turnera subulata TaxID=218843 RepID=A0A9Q0FBI7_9ROSI|nr:hypothetical protein Tsubulata_042402 [Turnera subulata]